MRAVAVDLRDCAANQKAAFFASTEPTQLLLSERALSHYRLITQLLQLLQR